MAFYAAGYRIRTEPFFREQKIRRFNLLKAKVFSKLRDKEVLENGYHDELSTFKLSYDLTEIKSSPYYAEASEYIKKDLPSPLITPEDLERLVTKFNSDVDKFILEIIPSNTYDILRTITTISNTRQGAVPPENSISLENVIPFYSTVLDFESRF